MGEALLRFICQPRLDCSVGNIASEKLHEMLGVDVRVAQNTSQKLGMEDFLRVKRNCNSFPIRVLVDHMASTLTRK